MSGLLMGFVGDVFVNRASPHEVFSEVRDVLSVPDILFGNLEGIYSNAPRPVLSAPEVVCAAEHNLDVYADVGFNVMSLANNHIVDVGHEAMLENRARLRIQGVSTCGAGDCLSDAREPAIVETKGVRVAFLAYASVFPLGYEARADRPGLVPMRGYNLWREPFPTLLVPGVRPLVTTIPDEGDLENLRNDIARARKRADLVVVSCHWGDHTCPFYLTDHETRIGRYCIDQGADMVVGHHHHSLRGVEWYRDRPIMYGLGHFVFDIQWPANEVQTKEFFESELGRYFKRIDFDVGPREGWPLLPYPAYARLTVLAWAMVGRDRISDVGVLPCRLRPDGVVHPLRLDSREGNEVVDYVDKCIRTQRLNTRIVKDNAIPIAGFDTVRMMPG